MKKITILLLSLASVGAFAQTTEFTNPNFEGSGGGDPVTQASDGTAILFRGQSVDKFRYDFTYTPANGSSENLSGLFSQMRLYNDDADRTEVSNGHSSSGNANPFIASATGTAEIFRIIPNSDAVLSVDLPDGQNYFLHSTSIYKDAAGADQFNIAEGVLRVILVATAADVDAAKTAYEATLSVSDFQNEEFATYNTSNSLELNADARISDVKVYNISGQVVSAKSSNDSSVSVSTEELSSGVYLVEATTVNGTKGLFKIAK